jgi:hypothetical protein
VFGRNLLTNPTRYFRSYWRCWPILVWHVKCLLWALVLIWLTGLLRLRVTWFHGFSNLVVLHQWRITGHYVPTPGRYVCASSLQFSTSFLSFAVDTKQQRIKIFNCDIFRNMWVGSERMAAIVKQFFSLPIVGVYS